MIDLIFLILLHSLQEIIHSEKQQVWVWIVWWYMVDWFDLPNLTSFTTWDESFYETTSLSLSSTSLIWSSSDIPFPNGNFSVNSNSKSKKNAFHFITLSSITYDFRASKRLYSEHYSFISRFILFHALFMFLTLF